VFSSPKKEKMTEVLIKDGVLYRLWGDMDETRDFEPLVIEHIKDIFSQSCEYFSKTSIEPIPGISKKREPDGFVVDFKNKKWFILELKVLGDYAINEIANQITDYKEISSQKQLKVISDSIKKRIKDENRNLVSDIIYDKDPIIVVIINSLEGDKGAQFRSRAKTADRLIEFKTFARLNDDSHTLDTRDVCHVFESYYTPTSMPQIRKPTLADYEENAVSISKKSTRATKGSVTTQKAYRIPILEALIEMGGKGKVKDVLGIVGLKMRVILKRVDYEKLPSGVDTRWSNAAMWERMNMVDEGLLKPVRESGRGIWEITEKGKRYYSEHK
jgi:hypothetical protein